jgi:hypothetical protein
MSLGKLCCMRWEEFRTTLDLTCGTCFFVVDMSLPHSQLQHARTHVLLFCCSLAVHITGSHTRQGCLAGEGYALD